MVELLALLELGYEGMVVQRINHPKLLLENNILQYGNKCFRPKLFISSWNNLRKPMVSFIVKFYIPNCFYLCILSHKIMFFLYCRVCIILCLVTSPWQGYFYYQAAVPNHYRKSVFRLRLKILQHQVDIRQFIIKTRKLREKS